VSATEAFIPIPLFHPIPFLPVFALPLTHLHTTFRRD
jgi:hypothetical protein